MFWHFLKIEHISTQMLFMFYVLLLRYNNKM